MGALISFLGGSAFRMVWGEISSYFSKKQDAKLELARLEAQGRLEAAAHERNLAAMRLQNDLGIKTVEASSAADEIRGQISAFAQAVADVGKSTGIKWLDIWNGSVRPLLATLAIGAVVIEIALAGWILSDWDRELFGAILGIYVADRSLSKRGK